MNIQDFKASHPYCEAAPYFPVADRLRIVGSTGFPLFGGQCRIEAHQIHHVVGQTWKGRSNDESNILHVNCYVHEWITDHSCAGRIISAWALHQAGRLDWALLSELDGKCWPGLFENPSYLADVQRFPWIAPYHEQLTRRAA